MQPARAVHGHSASGCDIIVDFRSRADAAKSRYLANAAVDLNGIIHTCSRRTHTKENVHAHAHAHAGGVRTARAERIPQGSQRRAAATGARTTSTIECPPLWLAPSATLPRTPRCPPQPLPSCRRRCPPPHRSPPAGKAFPATPASPRIAAHRQARWGYDCPFQAERGRARQLGRSASAAPTWSRVLQPNGRSRSPMRICRSR